MYEYVVSLGERAGYCVVTGRFVLVLAQELHGAISAVWPILEREDAHLEEIFARLIERGVSQAPDFAIAEIVDPAEHAVSVVVHGRAVAQLLDDPSSAVSGQGLSTWRESIWTGVQGFMLGIGDDRAGVETLPITGGVVRADWIRWSAETSGLPDATIIQDAAGEAHVATPISESVAAPGAGPSSESESAPAPESEEAPRRSRVRRPADDLPPSAPSRGAASAVDDDSLEDTADEEPVVVAAFDEVLDDSEAQPFLGNILSRPGVRLADGSLVHPDFPLVVGRNPAVRLSERGAPTIPVIVASPRRTISSSHLQIEAAGRAVLLTDLGTKNGALIRKPRGLPFVLGAGAEALVPVGTTIDLGEGVVLEIVLE